MSVKVAQNEEQYFSVLNPSTEECLGRVPDRTPDDALVMLEAAEVGHQDWSTWAPRARADVLMRAFGLMIAEKDRLAALIVAENGKPLAEALAEVDYAAEFLRWYAEESVRLYGSVLDAPGGQYQMLVRHQPVGISLLVTPWNLPAAMITRKVAPALAAGCAAIVKPAPETPLTALALADIFCRAGLPSGVLSMVTTTNHGPVVEALMKDDRVRKLSFTGSTAVGKLLLRHAADRVVNVSMELGGNAPFVVLQDADIDLAVEGAIVAKMRHNSEACTAANRFLVHSSVASAFTDRLSVAMAALRVGSGADPMSQVGPLIDGRAVDKVHGLVQGALSEGGRLRCGGERLDRPGYFYAPTVIGEVDPDADILRHEIFGPVAPVVSFDDLDEAVALANKTEHGLMSYVYTQDLRTGLAVGERIDAGMVAINRAVASDPAAPFGGTKESGIGREGAQEGIAAFLETKYMALSW